MGKEGKKEGKSPDFDRKLGGASKAKSANTKHKSKLCREHLGPGRTRMEAISKVTPGRSLGSCPQRPSCCVGGREGGPLTSNCCPRQDLEVSGVRLTERPQDAQRELGHSLGGGDFGELGPVLQAWLWSR